MSFKKNFYLCSIIVCFVFVSICFADSDLPYTEGELLVKFAPKANGVHKTTYERNEILSSINAGQVSVSFDQEYSVAYSWDGGYSSEVPFSTDALIFNSDPNGP